jgi:chromosome segregation protein
MSSRLISLELHGYKTFASRTEFQFANNVTAIVGPNGSGKSNIADSIRWVLGEQSYSLLRGKKTEDMIFAGSEQRARAGMASATIMFDNSDGWLPIDFSEVAITRRAYRDGQNEYLLNGQRVRLRDVSELLAQSGLAERTYTIIGQGLVDAALSLKAEERRRLFEEAAGIGLHRSRREEALKRLETTRRNLERVKDILAELQPRLRSLERQARRAQEYELVKADLRVLLLEWYGYHWHRAQTDLSEARDQARKKEKELDRIRSQQASLEDQASASRQIIQDLRSRLGEWHRQSAGLHSKRETLSRDLAVTDERLRSLTSQGQEWGKELARLEEQLALHDERVKEASDEVNQLQLERVEACQQVEATKVALTALKAERDKLEEEMQIARQTLSGLTARRSHLQARFSERQSQAKRHEEALNKSTIALEAAESDYHTALVILEGATEALQQVQAEREIAEETRHGYRLRLEDAENSYRSAAENQSSLHAEQSRFKAKLEVLEQAEQALSGYAAGVQLLLNAARQENIKGIRGALSNFLEVPTEYETAIAAALGEFVDAIILEGDNLSSVLSVLEGEASRAAILPIELLRPIAGFELSGRDRNADILGSASDLVRAPAELQPVINLLLGPVVVTRDRSSAQRFLFTHRPNDGALRVVTLQGEVFFASGQVLAGQGGKTGVLSRPRERRELQERIAEIETQTQALQEQIDGIELQLNELRQQGEQYDREVRTLQKREEDANTDYRSADLLLEKSKRQLQWHHEQLNRLEAEIKQGLSESAQIEAELTQIDADVAQARELLKQRSANLDDISLADIQTQLSHWNMRAAVAERAEVDARARLKERQTALENTIRSRQSQQSRLEDAQNATHELEQRKIALREAEAEVNDQVEALRQQIVPAETELQQAEQEQAELQTREAKARQSLSMAEHYHAQARITLARRQEALESMRRRIEDDFGLVAFEYAEEISGPTPLPLNGLVEQLPLVEKLSPEADDNIKRQRAQLRRMGAINPEAQVEFQQVKERFEFLNDQVADLIQAESGVKEVIAELDLLIDREFRKTFDAIAQEFREIFARLFGGGFAKLVLTDPEDMSGTGIDIEARLPGRRTQGLSLLSGGERSLTATALVFAILKVSPTPFCVLDEVDAMLDEANVGRFRELLRELSQSTQFVIVTHNRNTVQVADVIYGVTMGRDSSSQVIGLKLDQVGQLVD